MLDVKHALAALFVLAGISISACGSSGSPRIPVAGRLVAVPGSPTGHVVLTPVGAEQLGLQTAAVQSAPAPSHHAAGSPTVIVPYSALIYDSNGNTYVFRSLSPLTFTEVPISVDHISGNSVYLLRGPSAGARVVTVGAEELFGVQTGVLEQT